MRRLTRPKYSFTSGALPADTFTVVAFTGQEGVSQLYQFDLTLLADPGLDPQEVLNHAARFTIHRDGGDRVYHGVLSSLELFQAVGGTEWYRARLVPRLWWLGLTRHQQVFLDQTVPSFLEAVLLDGGLTTMDFQFRLRAGYPPVPFVCQYQESHWEFLCRWLEREGICFFFEQQAGFEKVVFSDDRAAHADLGQGQPLEYLPPFGLEDGRETVQAFACQSQVVPGRVLLKDHNYQRPSLELEGQAQVDPQGRGQVYLYGEHFGDTGEGARLATLRKEELLCRRQQYRGAGTAPCVAPGFLVRLARHFRAEFNRSYLVLEVRHQGSQAGALDAALRETMPGTMEVIYRNEFLAIPGDVQFRPPLQTRKPRVAGTLPGWIDGAGDGVHAELDDQGRYKVILPFDRSGRKGGKASIFLRMAQPYAGAEEGMHFPLRKGAEVLLTFIDGDPDRPVIAGALPNAAARSPVSGANQTRNRLLSPHGSEIQIDDDDGREGILMRVPAMDTFIQVGAQPPAAEGGEAPEPFQTGVHIQTGHQVWITSGAAGSHGEPRGVAIVYGRVTEQHFQTRQNGLIKVDDPDLAIWQEQACAHGGVLWNATVGPSFVYQSGPECEVRKGPRYAVNLAETTMHDQDDHHHLGELEGLPSGYLQYASAEADPHHHHSEPPDRFYGAWSGIKDNALGPMTAEDTIVSKRYGNSYSLTRGDTVSVTQGGKQSIQCGGRIVNQLFNDEGFKYFDRVEEDMVTTTRAWNETSGLLERFSYENVPKEFKFLSFFPLVPSVEVSMTSANVPETTIEISTTNKVEIEFSAGLQFALKGGLGAGVEIITKEAQVTYSNASGHFEVEGPGAKAEKEAHLYAKMEAIALKSCELALDKNELQLVQGNLIRSGEFKIDTSGFHFLG